MQSNCNRIAGFLFLFFNAGAALGAPCCGGSSAIPTLITGDDRAQVQASLSHGSIIGDAPAHGIPVFRSGADSEDLNVFNLAGAYRITDRTQVGLGIPIVARSRQTPTVETSASGLGDVILDLAYEALPDFTYSEWRPKGLVFLQATLPTGPSTYDSTLPFQIDARGRGFFTIGAGCAFLKNLANWDFLFNLEVHRSFRRTVTSQDGGSLTLSPSFGGTAMLGAGYSPSGGRFRIGAGLSPIYEGAMDVSGGIQSTSEPQLSWGVSVQAGYLISDNWSATLAYTDQTLLGPAQNVSLSRSVAISLQRRWPL